MARRDLPQRLATAAFTVANGERLWPLAEAREVVRWLARNGFGIFGGEVYAKVVSFAWGSYEEEWNTIPLWSAGEPWSAYVARGGAQALEALHTPTLIGRHAQSDTPRLYFIAYCRKEDYERAARGSFGSVVSRAVNPIHQQRRITSPRPAVDLSGAPAAAANRRRRRRS